MDAGDFTHSVIGSVHEVAPGDSSADTLRSAVLHEVEDCDAVRIVVDLTALDRVEAEQASVLVELIDPDDERWTVRLPDGTDPRVVEDMCAAGLGGRLLEDSTGEPPQPSVG